MPIFTQVFQASGTGKNGKPYTRWDYKTAEGERNAHFAATQEIPLNVPVALELSASGSIKSWKPVGSATPVENPQAAQESQGGPQDVSAAPVAPQAPSDRDKQIHRQTAAKVAAQLLAYFPAEEQSLTTFYTVAEQLVSYFATGDSIPF